MKYLLFLILLICFSSLSAQNPQSIIGRVVEQYSQVYIPFATIEELNTNAKTHSDSLGYFQLQKIPSGRVNLRISAMGFKPKNLLNIELLSGKQLQINVEMEENITLLNEVVITSSNNREGYNDMIKASRKGFSIEESKRYAGSLNDIQRMASSFAGVSTADDRVNDIIIRGNTPSGLLFRLDGMNIPNPNHWSIPGSSGGTVSMINNNVLRNSDFITGAFSAEYDAFSGVFDLRTRNGNYRKHEFLAQLGFNGLEAGAEGPISKKSKSSYLVNYRKSLLEVLSHIITPKTGSAVPKYQDLYFKLHFPTKKLGSFSLLALGGTSDIHFEPDTKKQNNYTYDDLQSGSKTGVVGLTHQHSRGTKTRFNTSLLFSTVSSSTRIDKVRTTEDIFTEPYVRNSFIDKKVELAHFTQLKTGQSNFFKAGFYLDFFLGAYTQDVFLNKIENTPKFWIRGLDYSDNYMQTNLYINYLKRFSERTELVAGITYKRLSLTQNSVIEPKLSLSYKTGEQGTLSFGSGLYSKAPSLIHVNVKDFTYNTAGNVVSSHLHNSKLDYIKSLHTVLGYDHFFNSNFHVKIEAYYQRLYDVIVAKNPTTEASFNNTYSSLNEFSFSFDEIPAILGNNGKGENYGLELTLEQFMKKGFYFLTTASLFNSKYEAIDKVWRSTRFNANLSANVLGGKEFKIGSKFKLLVDLKLTYMKGNRFIPLNREATISKNEDVYDYSQAYTQHLLDFFRTDFRIGYKVEMGKVSQEIAFEAQNLTNRKNVFMQQYNPNSKTIETLYQNGILPMGLYRIYF